jgi:Type I restriction enzyme R protein N terminus (HSDR_N)
MLVELKKPKLKDGKDQLRSYCNATGAPIAIWTNGDQISYYQRKDPNYFEDIPDLPSVNQTLADILQIKFTLEDLIAHDKRLATKHKGFCIFLFLYETISSTRVARVIKVSISHRAMRSICV